MCVNKDYNQSRTDCVTVLFQSFGSTFQIVMNEAWTDVTSEVMCRSKYWFVTNFYFIVIHLFSSLVRLILQIMTVSAMH